MPLKKQFDTILQSSGFLLLVKKYAGAKPSGRLFGSAVRALTKDEIALLEKNHNRCDNWNNILVSATFSPDHIFCSTFSGTCVLGHFLGKPVAVSPELSLPSGIYNSTIIDSEIGNDCVIESSCVSKYIIEGSVSIVNVGSLTCENKCTFGNGNKISVGIETGGREVTSFADMTIPIANDVAMQRKNEELQRNFGRFVKSYIDNCTLQFGIICAHSSLSQTPIIKNTFIGTSTIICGATLIDSCTFLSSKDEPVIIDSGAIVKRSCVQVGCHVSSLAIVDTSVLLCHSHVERHAKVTSSIIGANTVIAEGEVTASLVGPFVGFHHQALLIGAIWPLGKGNVGYGANAGSNHTSKAPDQELICGEGIFFGLGANVKFPADFSNAPYSIIATAVTTLPQRVEFPFSLINQPSRAMPNISPSFNEIIPAWVLSDNIYAVKRSEAKFALRNKVKCPDFPLHVFRPEIIDMIITARNRLKKVSIQKDIYLENDIQGIGKNFLTEESRIKAIAAYDFYIQHYCLTGLFAQQQKDDMFSFDNVQREHQKALLESEGFASRSIKENCERLIALNEKIAQDTQTAKAKDDKRGTAIIKDYADAHTLAAEDAFVKDTWNKTRELNKKIEEFIRSMK